MAKPNFFIVGAPKCGTTSLAKWINEHPNGFLSNPKEPYFFNTDIGPNKINSLKKYEDLFLSISSNHIAVGEASTIYLQSRKSIQNILNYNPYAKIIVMLRNPLDMVVSLHNEEIRSSNEDIGDFYQAWRAQDARKAGRKIPKGCIDPIVLQYRERASIGTQLTRLRKIVPPDQLKIILLDDILKDPFSIYSKTLEFLHLPFHPRKDFSPQNIRGLWRSNSLQKFLRLIGKAKKAVRIRYNTGILSPLGRWNRKPIKRLRISDEFWNELVEEFRDEVHMLSEECSRDLTYWLHKDREQ